MVTGVQCVDHRIEAVADEACRPTKQQYHPDAGDKRLRPPGKVRRVDVAQVNRNSVLAGSRVSLDRIWPFEVMPSGALAAHCSSNVRVGDWAKNAAHGSKHTCKQADLLEAVVDVNNAIRPALGDAYADDCLDNIATKLSTTVSDPLWAAAPNDTVNWADKNRNKIPRPGWTMTIHLPATLSPRSTASTKTQKVALRGYYESSTKSKAWTMQKHCLPTMSLTPTSRTLQRMLLQTTLHLPMPLQ